MASKFDPTIPKSESRVQSAPIRDSLNALNDRTDQLGPSATSPVSAGVLIGKADKIYFEDNTYAPYPGGVLDLGATSGVSSFNLPGTYKEIVVFYQNSSTLSFIESVEKITPVRDTANLINLVTNQRQPNISGQSTSVGSTSPLNGTILICSILVQNNGSVAQAGQILPIGDIDIVDLRPFMQRGGNLKALQAHISSASLALAHPNALISNSTIEAFYTTIAQDDTNVSTIKVVRSDLYGATDVVRISTSVGVTKDTIDDSTVWVTANVISTNDTLTTLTLDRTVSVQTGQLVVRGTVTVDKCGFELVKEFSRVTDLIRVDLVGPITTYKLGLNTVIDENVSSSAAIAGSKITPNFGSQAVSTTGTITGNALASTTTVVAGTNILASTGSVTAFTNVIAGGLVIAGTAPTTLTDSSGKILSAALNTVQIAQGGTALTSLGSANQILGANTGGSALEYKTVTGTANQIVITPSVGQLTFALPQDIAVTSSPSFAGLTITGFTTGIVHSNSSGILSSSLIVNADVSASAGITRSKLASGTANHVIINDVSGVLSSEVNLNVSRGGTGTGTFSTPTGDDKYVPSVSGTSAFASLLVTSANTVDAIVKRDGYGDFSAGTITATSFVGSFPASSITGIVATQNGGTGLNTTLGALNGNQLLGVNAAGSAHEYKTIQGVVNRTTVSFGVGAITVSVPQDIAITSSPTFSGLTLSSFTSAGVVTTNASGVLSVDVSALDVSFGGTGVVTIPSGELVVGAGTSPITTIAKTSANTPSTVVERDGYGDFSANAITAVDLIGSALHGGFEIIGGSPTIAATTTFALYTDTGGTVTLPPSPLNGRVVLIRHSGSGSIVIDGGANVLSDATTMNALEYSVWVFRNTTWYRFGYTTY